MRRVIPMEKKTGLVVLLDALGVKSFSIPECEHFIEARDAFLHELDDQLAIWNSKSGRKINRDALTLGDNVVYCVEHPVGDEIISNLARLVAEVVAWCIGFGLSKGIAWRGVF